MCNRYRLKPRPDELIDLFDLPPGMAPRLMATTEFYYPASACL